MSLPNSSGLSRSAQQTRTTCYIEIHAVCVIDEHNFGDEYVQDYPGSKNRTWFLRKLVDCVLLRLGGYNLGIRPSGPRICKISPEHSLNFNLVGNVNSISVCLVIDHVSVVAKSRKRFNKARTVKCAYVSTAEFNWWGCSRKPVELHDANSNFAISAMQGKFNSTLNKKNPIGNRHKLCW